MKARFVLQKPTLEPSIFDLSVALLEKRIARLETEVKAYRITLDVYRELLKLKQREKGK